jgi:hypothetical protein
MIPKESSPEDPQARVRRLVAEFSANGGEALREMKRDCNEIGRAIKGRQKDLGMER